VSRLQTHERVQAPVQIGPVLTQRAVLEVRPSSADGQSAQDQPLEPPGERIIAGVQSVLDVAQEMSIMPMSA
jgi:hypothetical protein